MTSMNKQIAEQIKRIDAVQSEAELLELGKELWSDLRWHSANQKVWATANDQRLEIKLDAIGRFRTAENPLNDLFGIGGGRKCGSQDLFDEIGKFAGKNLE